MNIVDLIRSVYPELTDDDFAPNTAIICINDDSDGQGQYISKWEYSKPIPDGLTLGKPTA